MTDPPGTPPGRRPGGGNARVRAQVLDAVRAERAAGGPSALTVEGAAKRAGVHRATVDRRRRDVGGLLADLVDAAGEFDRQPPDTGSLRGDLTALNQEIQAEARRGQRCPGPRRSRRTTARGTRTRVTPARREATTRRWRW